MTQAVNIATNAAEEYLASDDFESFTVFYDEEWNEISGEGSYKTTATVTAPEADGTCGTMRVVVATAEDEEIYSLEVEKAQK